MAVPLLLDMTGMSCPTSATAAASTVAACKRVGQLFALKIGGWGMLEGSYSQVRKRTMADRTATMPLTIDMMTPAMARMTVMIQSPIPWIQLITAPMLAVLC